MKATLILSALVAGALGHDRQAMMSRPSTGPNGTAAQILAPQQDPWYSAPANYESAAPGTILKIRPAAGNLTSVQSNSSAAYNILYRTTDSRYNATWAVTTLFVPANASSNDKLLSYQIAYDSADLDASPSYALYSGPYPDIVTALGQGWFVNVPDYEGPLASFTAGAISGHATLDSVRAVLASGLGLNTTSAKYAMWGYSGGALASEWAAELQVQYAPELNFAGAALGGLTPNISSVLLAVSGSLQAGLIPAGILGLASQYPELDQYLTDNLKTDGEFNATGFREATNYTVTEAIVAFASQDITQYFSNGAGTLFDPIPRSVINREGIMGYHGVPKMPVFAYKAIMDEVSPVNDTDILVDRYCQIGATIKYDRNTIGSHSTESGNGEARALSFLNSVLGGMYNATGCQIQNVTLNGTMSS
ncbi:Trichothecene C-3 esterase [Fulvia fulva]|uniref:Trichothecene C-3 esterase n=1 Tax=Passalora fulva TaxID=5499 RepID=A0A9Q8PHT3_PASFU|nr:Trichothecene C-3 esterase [Fulvia fulva]KAK4616537.1 Trichothecene C-3 esterase [Fulvia fulva]UJO22698.1 Trichothecene C-3 esterase [Fulvia fulva]WPV33685.1 Trichothecene C-3 esterase [Fulvia fulva]